MVSFSEMIMMIDSCEIMWRWRHSSFNEYGILLVFASWWYNHIIICSFQKMYRLETLECDEIDDAIITTICVVNNVCEWSLFPLTRLIFFPLYYSHFWTYVNKHSIDSRTLLKMNKTIFMIYVSKDDYPLLFFLLSDLRYSISKNIQCQGNIITTWLSWTIWCVVVYMILLIYECR